MLDRMYDVFDVKYNKMSFLNYHLVEYGNDNEFNDTCYELEDKWLELVGLTMELNNKFQETIELEEKWKHM